MTTLRDALEKLLRLAGARYSCVADPETGGVLAEQGAEIAGGVAAQAGAVLSWGTDAARFLAAVTGDGLEDLIVTSRRAYHLVRQVRLPPAPPGRSRSVLVYLCLDRARGNLAMARRELAAVRLTDVPGPAPSGAGPVTVPQQAPSPTIERAGAGPVVPLPRRSPAALPPPIELPPVPDGPRWSADVDTMRRLLDGLRKLR